MNFSHEEAGRNKTSGVILRCAVREKALSANMNLSWLIALWCWPRKRFKEGRKKKKMKK